jgi:hypothetical protein
MKLNEQIRIIIISYIVSVLLVLVIEYLMCRFTIMNSIQNSIKITTLLTFWWIFYFKFGWKIPYFNKILYKLNLNGTWFGIYESININTKIKLTGEIGLRINQDFLNISIISFTEKYQNYSYSEELKYEEKSKTHGIVYVYSQKENNYLDLNQRNGTSELRVINAKKSMCLEGNFWTVHGTSGNIKVNKISDTIIDNFFDAKEIAKKLSKNIVGENK